MRVLAPLDGTQEAFDALRAGMAVLAGCKPLVRLLVVRQAGFESAPEDVTQAFDDDEDDQIFPSEQSARRVLDRGAALCVGVDVEKVCLEGRPRDVILEQARDADVLLMQALRKASLREKLTLSSAEYLVRHSPCTVLLAKA